MSVTPVSRCGSSPHTRGAPPAPEEMDESDGIIPAYAGSTTVAQSASGHGTDHPRIRGEHDHALFFAGWRRGSSPHTRGALARLCRILKIQGIIPAYAGSTFTFSGLMVASADHPRIRGEHGCVRRVSCALAGSSPHTRGALVTSRVALPTEPDHPRIRGEHRRPPDRRVAQGGSSPHTRGARRRSRWRRRRGRIIPAYAGSTSRSSAPRTAGGDHPRIRGEHKNNNFVGL